MVEGMKERKVGFNDLFLSPAVSGIQNTTRVHFELKNDVILAFDKSGCALFLSPRIRKTEHL